MNTRFTSGEKIAVGWDAVGNGAQGGSEMEGRARDRRREVAGRARRTTKPEGGTANKAPVQSASTARLKNKLLRASCLACSIFEAGILVIPEAKSCESVGKLGETARGPEGATETLLMETFGEREEAGDRGKQVDRRKKEDTGVKEEENEEGLQGNPSGREDLWSFSQARWKKRMKGAARRRPIGSGEPIRR